MELPAVIQRDFAVSLFLVVVEPLTAATTGKGLCTDIHSNGQNGVDCKLRDRHPHIVRESNSILDNPRNLGLDPEQILSEVIDKEPKLILAVRDIVSESHSDKLVDHLDVILRLLVRSHEVIIELLGVIGMFIGKYTAIDIDGPFKRVVTHMEDGGTIAEEECFTLCHAFS